MKKEERFEIILKEGSSLSESGMRLVLVDKATGVNYLVVKSGYGTGITPLLTADGKPMVCPV